MLRKSLSVVVGLFFATALLVAQASQAQIKKARDQVDLSNDIRVGSTVLKSGRYEVKSSPEGLTFRHMVRDVANSEQWNYDTEQEPVVVKVAATPLPEKSRGTELDMSDVDNGVRVLKAVTIDGTDQKLTIEQ